jgi:hypothetical protein
MRPRADGPSEPRDERENSGVQHNVQFKEKRKRLFAGQARQMCVLLRGDGTLRSPLIQMV